MPFKKLTSESQFIPVLNKQTICVLFLQRLLLYGRSHRLPSCGNCFPDIRVNSAEGTARGRAGAGGIDLNKHRHISDAERDNRTLEVFMARRAAGPLLLTRRHKMPSSDTRRRIIQYPPSPPFSPTLLLLLKAWVIYTFVWYDMSLQKPLRRYITSMEERDYN